MAASARSGCRASMAATIAPCSALAAARRWATRLSVSDWRDSAGAIVQLCEAHELELEDINRALLRVLSELAVERPGGH